MRDRLIKLLQDNSYLDVLNEEHWLLAAEQLLANGVMVIDTDVVSLPNRPLISQYMGRPIDEVINLIRKSEWISVDERLPENDYGKHWKDRQHYLVVTEPSGLMRVARFGSKEFPWWIDSHDTVMTSANYAKVTHWMPLPEAPKGGEE